MKSLSIKDIAVKANVSITTVSFIINGKAKEKSISDAVIEKVEKIIEESGYKPNQIARSLRTGNSNIIGLIIEDISNSFFSRIARLIEDKAYKKGYKIIYSSTENSIDKAKELINMFKSRKVDAYIISPIKGIEEDIQMLLDDGNPVILFDRNLPAVNTSYVGADHFNASYQSIQSFIDQGKKNIALVTTDINVEQVIDRYNGYKKALEDNGIRYDDNLVLKIHFNQEEGETMAQIKELLQHKHIDAVLFATNYLAISGLKVLKQINKAVGADFGVIAYDDHEAFELHTPRISAIQQPLEEIAETIIKLILSQLSTKSKLPAEEVIIPSRLVLRD
ncbi:MULTISPECIES: LacI family DNA-binding transcriptional regulator [Pedobacter]|uniref:LacI family transcriptional regulator n=1 Tax=Pedobacter zeae TaxID=1737356 RepID=A0A7W6KGG8_9SPHI|nr:LacI family DNA-binding transcriptional regulator [Pedobacter zeae]MBB4110386.1 LacI family transcriptional regulator [Pedobacter zeae]GGH17639.1 LacI family transcriptional regulator [Pedobacter zeae]